ncbi:uncharacterized protein LOC129984212 [Argiope bruennichi]|uniref:uncharacterized protein LOC129984212 n=1 Tax=Argiope bruennichi TaxID=94029 RepID=UPI0024943756|nr:uncharacterized protein LOC129984212 [Argiope bruennichi]
MDIAQSVNNVLYNIGEYSCDISKLVLGNNFSHQYISRSLLVDSSEKKSNFMNAFSFPDETTVYPTEDSDDKNGTGQCYSAHKWPKVSVEDLAFTKQISEALGVTEDSMVDKSQNSEKTSAKSDLQNEIASFDNVSYEAKKKSCKNIEKSNVHSKQDSGNIVNKSDIHKKNSKEGKQNNKKVTDLKISKKFKRSSESFTSLKKQQNSKIVRKKNLFMCSRSRRKLLHNTLQNAYILSKSKKSEQCIPSIDANKECLTAVEANESFSTISESLISNNLIDNDSNACPTSTNSENLDFEIKEHTNFETLLEKNKEICAPRKEFMKQINILEDSNSKITCVNLDEVKSSFDNKISVTSFNDKYGKQVLNFSDKNENPDVTSELENIGKETKMDLLNNKNGFTTEIDHSQKQSSKKPKSKNEILSLCKSSLKKSKSVLRSKSGKSPKESSATSSKYSLSILYNTDEFLAALGEKKITAEKKRHAEIVMNGIRELGIEGFQKFLPEAI